MCSVLTQWVPKQQVQHSGLQCVECANLVTAKERVQHLDLQCVECDNSVAAKEQH